MSVIPYALTAEEWELIRSSVLLPMVLSMIEKNRKALDSEHMSMKRLYMMATDLLAGRIKAEVARIKKELWAQKIRVLAPNVVETKGFAYVCRGVSNQVVMTQEEIQSEIRERLVLFMDQLGQELGNEHVRGV